MGGQLLLAGQSQLHDGPGVGRVQIERLGHEGQLLHRAHHVLVEPLFKFPELRIGLLVHPLLGGSGHFGFDLGHRTRAVLAVLVSGHVLKGRADQRHRIELGLDACQAVSPRGTRLGRG